MFHGRVLLNHSCRATAIFFSIGALEHTDIQAYTRSETNLKEIVK